MKPWCKYLRIEVITDFGDKIGTYKQYYDFDELRDFIERLTKDVRSMEIQSNCLMRCYYSEKHEVCDPSQCPNEDDSSDEYEGMPCRWYPDRNPDEPINLIQPDAERTKKYAAMNLRQIRESKNLSQKGLGILCHLSQSQISLYERGRTFPTYHIRKALCESLGLDVEEQVMCFSKMKKERNKNVVVHSYR